MELYETYRYTAFALGRSNPLCQQNLPGVYRDGESLIICA